MVQNKFGARNINGYYDAFALIVHEQFDNGSMCTSVYNLYFAFTTVLLYI